MAFLLRRASTLLAPRWAASAARFVHASAALRFEEGGFDGEEAEEDSFREGRPFPDPKASRRIEAIRNDPLHKAWGGMIDILEHDAYCNKVREADGDGFYFDHTVGPGESDCDEDPFSNGYLTEDEIQFDENYTPSDYLPDSIKRRMYYLHMEKGWDVKRLAERFGLRTDRVSVILNMKATEGEMKDSGRYREEVDNLLSQLYAGKHKFQDKEPSKDIGINVQMLEDQQDPEDMAPRVPALLRGNIIRAPKVLEKIPQPPASERAFRSKYAFKDISGGAYRRGSVAVMVDYDGKQRPMTRRENEYRTWEVKYGVSRPGKGIVSVKQ